MRYFYVDENDHAAGPVEEASFYEALRVGALDAGTLVAAEGSEDWEPLASVLPYYFTYGEGRAGPLPLAKLQYLATTSPEPLMVMEPGTAEWFLLADLLPPAVAAAPDAAPAEAFDPYAPPATAVAMAAPAPGLRPPFPGSVKAAGIIWILYGALRLVTSAVVAYGLLQAGGLAGLALIGLLIPLFVGMVFLRIGMHAWQGTLTQVKSNGTGSICVGMVLFIMTWFMVRNTAEYTPRTLLVEAAVDAALVVAGILTLRGQSRFLAWKEWTAPRAVTALYRR